MKDTAGANTVAAIAGKHDSTEAAWQADTIVADTMAEQKYRVLNGLRRVPGID